ncbi:hypothetical protein [uncultured Tenacibaculum sp.]|uniref:hypothetical protein n=1 Tax=uncultured Tenacibaculum sp. TaxID=174713 RepID=UPI002637A1A0|nr:hypothetical protein [uncultured Tenacibaculum sp.]
MKKRNTYFLILIGSMILTSCNRDYSISSFDLAFTNWYGSEGFMLKYVIDKDSVRIHYDCDFENCKDTIIYNRKLSKKETYNFYEKLKELRTDTLKKFYIGEYLHGRQVLEISGDSLESKKVILMSGYYHPVLEKLTIEIDKLLQNEKYLINRR